MQKPWFSASQRPKTMQKPCNAVLGIFVVAKPSSPSVFSAIRNLAACGFFSHPRLLQPTSKTNTWLLQPSAFKPMWLLQPSAACSADVQNKNHLILGILAASYHQAFGSSGRRQWRSPYNIYPPIAASVERAGATLTYPISDNPEA